MLSLIFVAAITALYLILGRSGMARLQKERAGLPKSDKHPPLVSIIIPAYNASRTIGHALKSANAQDYPRKEVIVVNESNDSTPTIVRSHGARLIQNKKRLGKANALNAAIPHARGDLLFFLDSDTTIDRTCLSRLVPWFSRKDVSAVMPRYGLRNNVPVARLAHVENIFTFALLRVHLFFGSIAGFRGCSVMIRKSVMKKHPWPNTLMEDNHLAATLVSRGHRIIYEPNARARTDEPETISELRRQKNRWGEGAYLAFKKHRSYYLRSPQFMIFFYPYFALGIITGLLVLGLLASPLLFPGLALPIIAELVVIFISMYFHTLIFLKLGGGGFLPGRTFKFMTVYFSIMTYAYFRGILRGIKRKKSGRKELNLESW